MQVSNNAQDIGELHVIIKMEKLLGAFLLLYPEMFFSLLQLRF